MSDTTKENPSASDTMNSLVSFLKKARSAMERFFAPGFGTCKCCTRPWKFIKHHCTNYTASSGCFPLCQDCWEKLRTPGRRMPFYRELWEEWQTYSSDTKWEEIEQAVLKEN